MFLTYLHLQSKIIMAPMKWNESKIQESHLKPTMKLQRFLSLPVISSISLMGFVYITVLLLIHDWVGLYTSPGILNASFFTILCSLCLFSFLVCVLKDPGFVPPSYHPDLEHIHVINRASGKDVSKLVVFFCLFSWNSYVEMFKLCCCYFVFKIWNFLFFPAWNVILDSGMFLYELDFNCLYE